MAGGYHLADLVGDERLPIADGAEFRALVHVRSVNHRHVTTHATPRAQVICVSTKVNE